MIFNFELKFKKKRQCLEDFFKINYLLQYFYSV